MGHMGGNDARVPSLRSRVAAGIAGGAGALGVTVALGIAQAGHQLGDQPAAAAPAPHAVVAAGSTGAAGAAVTTPAAPATGTAPASPGARPPAPAAPTAPVSALAAAGIPATALAAYRDAALAEAKADSGCHLPWALLAGIGRVESDHGRFAGAVLHADGVSTPRIIGIPLDGHGTEVIRDTDHGRLDGDTVWDRAVGPMQFIPSTWAAWGRDGNGDGVRDPFNLFDAARAAADYLCAAGGDLGTAAGQEAAVLSYNHSAAYLAEVLGLERVYALQFGERIPSLPTLPVSPVSTPTLPPVDPAGGRTAASTGRSTPAAPS
jgi:membrane-bound lytic murein transglycosylase B